MRQFQNEINYVKYKFGQIAANNSSWLLHKNKKDIIDDRSNIYNY